MTLHEDLSARPRDPSLDGIIKLAILAVGGQGGGVLTGWIEAVARRSGHVAQATSVAGVAQRTGATIYYVEMCPAGERMPVLSLAPSPGDVDVVIAAEMMEAGRAILRGFVTPDRTTLIASTHRALAVSEKTVPGDGIASSEEVRAAAEIAARRLAMADFEAIATGAGSVISASLLGGLAGSNALPFAREAFEAAIRAGGKGVEPSLRAFAAGFDAVRGKPPDTGAEARGGGPLPTPAGARLPLSGGPVVEHVPAAGPAPAHPGGPAAEIAAWRKLAARVAAMPPPVAALAGPGLRKVVDFLDCDYGREYLDRLDRVLAQDDPAQGFRLSAAAAKHIANAMAYDDVIRVADLKTREDRFERIAAEMDASEANLVRLTEFMHPRAEEIVGMLPARLGRRLRESPASMTRIGRWFGKGRRLRSDGVLAFTALYLVGGLRGWRRRTLRHADEVAHLDAWLAAAMGYRPDDYGLAVETLNARRLIKGYSDTHARGLSKFDRVMEGIALVAGREDAADWARRLREAALADEKGEALDGALHTIRSFA